MVWTRLGGLLIVKMDYKFRGKNAFLRRASSNLLT